LSDGKFEPEKVRECLGLKEIFSAYEAGKTRRYGLLFTLIGAAFTLASYLLKDAPNPDYSPERRRAAAILPASEEAPRLAR
jgi:hypothetical protein